jgi:hypothetical protein
MANQTYLDFDLATTDYVRVAAPHISTGATDAYTLFATGADGKFDLSLIPSVEASVETIQATENIPARSFVTIYDVAGARRIQLAIATNRERPPMGFVEVGVNTSENATVQIGGIVKASTSGFVADDVKKPVFLGTTGGAISKTLPPETSGNVVWLLGRIVEFGTTLRMTFQPQLLVRYQ